MNFPAFILEIEEKAENHVRSYLLKFQKPKIKQKNANNHPAGYKL